MRVRLPLSVVSMALVAAPLLAAGGGIRVLDPIRSGLRAGVLGVGKRLISAQFRVSQPVPIADHAFRTARRGAELPAAASAEGGELLVAWRVPEGSAGAGSIVATRLTNEGWNRDAVEPLLLSASPAVSAPSVAWGGSRWIVTWTELVEGVPSIVFRTVGLQKSDVTDAIVLASGDVGSPRVAADGDGQGELVFLSGGRVHGVALSRSGGVHAEPQRISGTGADSPDVACSGFGCIVVFRVDGGARAQRLGGAGELLDGAAVNGGLELGDGATPLAAVRVAAEAGGYLAVLVSRPEGGVVELSTVEVPRRGQPAAPKKLIDVPQADLEGGLRLCSEGGAAQAVLVRRRGGGRLLVAIDAARGAERTIADLGADASSPAPFDAGGKLGATWVAPDAAGVPQAILLSPGLEPAVASLELASQRAPSVVVQPTGTMVVWADDRAGTDGLYASRLDEASRYSTGAGIALCDAGGDVTETAATFDGRSLLVAWILADGSVRAVRTGREPVAGEPFAILPPGPARSDLRLLGLAHGGWLVSFADAEAGIRVLRVRAAADRVEATPLDAPFASSIRIVRSGTGLLECRDEAAGVLCRRLGPEGAPASADVPFGSSEAREARCDCGVTECAISWVEPDGTVFASIVPIDGTPEPAWDPIPMSLPVAPERTELMFDGIEYVVAWTRATQKVARVEAERLTRIGTRIVGPPKFSPTLLFEDPFPLGRLSLRYFRTGAFVIANLGEERLPDARGVGRTFLRTAWDCRALITEESPCD